MRLIRNSVIFGSVFSLSITRAYAVQISLSNDSIDHYFQILERYVLPLMVVSTVVLFCGYLASRVYHRTVSRRQDGAAGRDRSAGATDDGTEAFLRELKTTPPIEDREPQLAPLHQTEPAHTEGGGRARPHHPLLRRRAAAAARSAAEAKQSSPPQPAFPPAPPPQARPAANPAPVPQEPAPGAEPRFDTYGLGTDDSRADEPHLHAPAAGRETGRGAIPRLQAAFRRPQRETPHRETPHREPPAPAPEARPQRPPMPQAAPVLRADNLVSGAEGDSVEPIRRQEPPRMDIVNPPPLSGYPSWRNEGGDRPREEPTVSVVQALKTGPSSGAAEFAPARARAGEIVDSLDYIASILQQGSVLLADRLRNKQGLSLEDIREMRISGFDEPQNVLEDLRKLGGDAAQEVLAAYAAVSAFNKIVRRLEQMAETDALDEGWNDLVRARISETIYAVGQVRKTLGIYRRAVKKPANSGAKPGAAGGTQ